MNANDTPFKVGDKVAVVRSCNGWYNGRAEAEVTSRYKNAQGTWSYYAKGLGEYEGHEFEVKHTRDARAVK